MGLSEKILAILVVLCVSVLVCGCLGGEQSSSEATDTASEEESPSTDRYIEITLLDGTKVGGKYVSETAAFTTIIAMYTMDPNAYTSYNTPGSIKQGYYHAGPMIRVKDPDGYLVKANGTEISIKNSVISVVVTIDDPTPMIEATLEELNAIAIARKNASEMIDEGYRLAAEARAAK